MIRKWISLTAMVVATQFLAGALSPSGAGVARADVRLQGAGSTFVNPLMQRWVAEYQKINPGAKIDYQSIGSGGGIKGICDKTVDFAASDAPMNKKELESAGGADGIVEIPACAGGVVPAYNLPGISKDIHFTGPVLAEIFMGTIAKWNDPKLTALNPEVKLPDLAITPAWRTDGSGTTFIWTNYLATQSEAYKNAIGMGKQVKWPVGQGGKGNEGVTAIVEGTAGAIGYIEEGYADANKIPYGAIQNKAGKFVKASPKTVSLAGQGAAGAMKGNLLAAGIWNQAGEDVYPASGLVYVIIYKNLANLKSKDQAATLAKFLGWATHDGQKYTEELGYAPLASPVVAKVEAALKLVTYKGDTSLAAAAK